MRAKARTPQKDKKKFTPVSNPPPNFGVRASARMGFRPTRIYESHKTATGGHDLVPFHSFILPNASPPNEAYTTLPV